MWTSKILDTGSEVPQSTKISRMVPHPDLLDGPPPRLGTREAQKDEKRDETALNN